MPEVDVADGFRMVAQRWRKLKLTAELRSVRTAEGGCPHVILANDQGRTTNDPPNELELKHTPMADRTFTLEEAQSLLPVLESLLRTAIDGKKLIEAVDTELQELAHRVFLQGGLLVNVVHMARRKAEREKAIPRVKDALAEIDATGVQVKDLDIGLLDFPCKVDGHIVLLCWKLGEHGISYWHDTTEGFAGRKPIDEKIIKAKKTN